jgi:hypothetical protein
MASVPRISGMTTFVTFFVDTAGATGKTYFATMITFVTFFVDTAGATGGPSDEVIV